MRGFTVLPTDWGLIAHFIECRPDNQTFQGSNTTSSALKVEHLYPILHVSFGRNVSCWSILSGVYVWGSKRSDTGCKGAGPFYLVSTSGEVRGPTQGVKVLVPSIWCLRLGK